jgi:PhnB protein
MRKGVQRLRKEPSRSSAPFIDNQHYPAQKSGKKRMCDFDSHSAFHNYIYTQKILMQNNIYLLFNGNCEEAMNFYKDALGGKIEMISRFSEAPMPSADADKNRIMHGVVAAGDMRILFSDCPADRPAVMGTNFSISLASKSDEDITKAFNGLSAGGEVTLALQPTFWSPKFGMCKDKFGVAWMFSLDAPKAS